MINDPESEIDLWQLLIKAANFFKKNKGLIGLFFFLGILFSLSKFIFSPLEYRSYFKKEFVAESPVTTVEVLSDIINGSSLFPEKIHDLRNIKGKLAKNAKGENRLQVTIESFEKENIDSILDKLTQQVNAIKDLKEKYDFNKGQLTDLHSAIEIQIAKQDSTHVSLELMEKKQQVEKDLKFLKIVQFTATSADIIYCSNNRTIILNILGFGFLGIVVGAILAFLRGMFK